MFYDKLQLLCTERGMTVSGLLETLNMSKSSASRWKSKGYSPSPASVKKIADYFEIPVAELLESKKEALTQDGERKVTEEDLKAAFYGGYSDDLPAEVIDELWDDAKEYARFKAEQRKKKK